MATKQKTKYALVTGATSGFGYEFCKLLAADGYNLVVVARSEERLQIVSGEIITQYGVEVLPLSADLFQPHTAEGIYETVKEQGVTVDDLHRGLFFRRSLLTPRVFALNIFPFHRRCKCQVLLNAD